MQDYAISKCTRKCAVSGRPLEPGETYISAILPDGDSVRRVDIAMLEWKGPPPEAIGWWKCRMPQATARKLRPAPNGVLLDTLSELLERPDKLQLSYLLAVLLVRRRVLTEEESLGGNETASHEVWALTCPADGRVWNIPITTLDSSALPGLREELSNLLFTEE